MAKQSFFAEKRSSNNNPNFFNFMSIDEIRKSVKRIIRDVKFDNIQDQDYVYFTNAKVISACLEEAKNQWLSASVLVNALNYYINDGLSIGYLPHKNMDIGMERSAAANEQLRQNSRCYMWMEIYRMFDAIFNGADAKTTLAYIKYLQFNVNEL